MRLLARSVTAIVIARDIVPSHYSSGSGAIYLQAEFFWRTLEERAVITARPDYRRGFGATIPLYIPRRSVRNNTMLTLWTAPGESRPELPVDATASLLYHELSHPADFVQASRLDDVVPYHTVWQMAVADYQQWPSSQLTRSHPLGSTVLRDLATVFFHGRSPTPEQEALHPNDVIDEFALDGAVAFYSYSTQYEDLANLHETLLMSYHHGYENDVAVVHRDAESLWDAIVAWGQRGRMTDRPGGARPGTARDRLDLPGRRAGHARLPGGPARAATDAAGRHVGREPRPPGHVRGKNILTCGWLGADAGLTLLETTCAASKTIETRHAVLLPSWANSPGHRREPYATVLPTPCGG